MQIAANGAASRETFTMNKSTVSRLGVQPIRWATISKTPDPVGYKNQITGRCATVRQCAGHNDPTVVNDCTVMIGSYQCAAVSSIEAFSDEEGMFTMDFTGQLDQAPGPEDWGGEQAPDDRNCVKHRSCSGPWAQTTHATVQGGHCVRWEYSSAGKTDWYEIYVGLFEGGTDKLLHETFQRGHSAEWSYAQLKVDTTSDVYLKYYLASYDNTGGFAIGADIKVRNLVHGPCMTNAQLAAGPFNCVTNGAMAPLTEDGYYQLAQCCCNYEMEEYMRRLLQDEGLQLCYEGGLQGLVPWYSCSEGSQTLALMREAVLEATETKGAACPWVTEIGKTCVDPQPPACGSFSRPISHRRRTCGRNTQ